MCVLGGCTVDASLNANACRLKMGASVCLLFGKVYFGLLVLAVIFSSPEGHRAREMHLSSILDFNSIDLVRRDGIYGAACIFS